MAELIPSVPVYLRILLPESSSPIHNLRLLKFNIVSVLKRVFGNDRFGRLPDDAVLRYRIWDHLGR